MSDNSDDPWDYIIQFFFNIVQPFFEKNIQKIILPFALILPIKLKYIKFLITVIVIITFMATTATVINFIHNENKSSTNKSIEKENTTKEHRINYSNILPGIYSVSIYYEDRKQDSKTAKIQFYKNQEYRLIFVSEYAPEFIKITLNDDGNLSSDKIGEGTLSYKKELDKTAIIFKKDSYVWKLIK